ncbi:MAG: cation diffusion facilitator family transporter [Campylobacterota bacterium]|nr:cation diffusion facilitator family transporter [Campylobacterota bacterium]
MQQDKKRNVLFIIALNLIIVAAEIFYGLLANSIALITDAFHNLGDVLAVVITYSAIVMSSKKPTFKYTFGFLKAEMMAAFVNALFLVITLGFLIYESAGRLFEPQQVQAEYMIVVALIALVANAVSAYLLSEQGMGHHHDHHDLNIRSAYLHMLGDALISLGVVAGGVIIYFFGIYMIDALLSILFSLYILKETVPLLRRSFLSLMEANLSDVRQEDIEAVLLKNEHVSGYHDLHLSQPKSNETYLTVHLLIDSDLNLSILDDILEQIREDFKLLGITHTVIQSESNSYTTDHPFCNTH